MPSEDKPLRQANIYAPSFTWTFWIDKVQYYFCEIPYYSTNCDVLDIKSTVPGVNMYGQISSAYIKLRGTLNPVETTRDRICVLKELQLGAAIERPKWAKVGLLPRISCDFHRSDDWDHLLFLKFFTRREPKSDPRKDLKTNGMIVCETDIPGTYRRVGTASNIPQRWLESNMSPTEITIV
jgi:hypothetical protein